jgi:hypothetical protein
MSKDVGQEELDKLTFFPSTYLIRKPIVLKELTELIVKNSGKLKY